MDATVRIRRSRLLVAAAVVLVAICVGAYFAVKASTKPAPPAPFSLTGTLQLTSDSIKTTGLPGGYSCAGDRNDNDIGPGATVTVADETGKLIAKGEIQSSYGQQGSCLFLFRVNDVPGGEKFYRVQVAQRGDTSYTEAEAKAGINLVLGSTVTSPTGTPPLPAPLPTSNPAPTTQPPPIPPSSPSSTVPPQPRPPGDLGLPTPISNPPCNGQVIVILGNITTPGLYAAGVQQLLDAHPGAYYLRTDQSCPSLRRANEAGNPIYAVFEPTTPGEVCKAVRLAGGGAYGKWLDYTHDPGYIIHCP